MRNGNIYDQNTFLRRLTKKKDRKVKHCKTKTLTKDEKKLDNIKKKHEKRLNNRKI